MLGCLLSLLKACMNYDFLGTCFDGSLDDTVTIHVPTDWKECKFINFQFKDTTKDTFNFLAPFHFSL